MKRVILSCIVLVLLGLLTSAYSQTKALKRGFSLNLISGFPSPNNFGVSGLDPDLKNYFEFGLEIGNRWYIKPQEKFGFGIMVNWFDVTFASAKVSPPKEFSNNKTVVYSLSFLELGPIGTYAVNPNLGIDVYYNLKPTYMKSAIYLDEQYDKGEPFGFGLTHSIGGTVRWKVFALGVEYVFGKVKTLESVIAGKIDNTTGNTTTLTEPDKLSAKHFRLLLGFKF